MRGVADPWARSAIPVRVVESSTLPDILPVPTKVTVHGGRERRRVFIASDPRILTIIGGSWSIKFALFRRP
jgi:hypothetical protein